jgi:hypothetical protein
MTPKTFARRKGKVVLTVDEGEIQLLRDLFAQLADLLEPAAEAVDDDPLNALVGIGTATKAPDDPALARLLPDAYPEDPEAAADFRRYTELSLRESKRQRIALVLGTLEVAGQPRVLTDEEVVAWLTTINDLRLVLGTRLDVSEDPEEDWTILSQLPQDDPAVMQHALYDWLGTLQYRLLEVLA